jgi:hypothetical protein
VVFAPSEQGNLDLAGTNSFLYLACHEAKERRLNGMTPTSISPIRFNSGVAASTLRCVKHVILPSAIFGACIGALESVIKGGAARAIFVTVSFALFVVMWNRRKLS